MPSFIAWLGLGTEAVHHRIADKPRLVLTLGRCDGLSLRREPAWLLQPGLEAAFYSPGQAIVGNALEAFG